MNPHYNGRSWSTKRCTFETNHFINVLRIKAQTFKAEEQSFHAKIQVKVRPLEARTTWTNMLYTIGNSCQEQMSTALALWRGYVAVCVMVIRGGCRDGSRSW